MDFDDHVHISGTRSGKQAAFYLLTSLASGCKNFFTSDFSLLISHFVSPTGLDSTQFPQDNKNIEKKK